MDGEQNTEPTWQFTPGQTVTPGQSSTEAVQQTAPEPANVQSVAIPPEGSEGLISWHAAEYIHHQKIASGLRLWRPAPLFWRV